jgi:hypothetical protein
MKDVPNLSVQELFQQGYFKNNNSVQENAT